jgi:hypothetical protein
MNVRIVDDAVDIKVTDGFSDESGRMVDNGVLPPHNKYPPMRDVVWRNMNSNGDPSATRDDVTSRRPIVDGCRMMIRIVC